MENNSDNSSNRDLGSDRQRVASGQEHEVRYLAEKLNCSTEDVEAAIRAVGNSREEVEKYLKSRK